MTLDKLIEDLVSLRKKVDGSTQVYAAGEDYPNKVSEVFIQTKQDAYIPKGVIRLRVKHSF